MTKREILTAAMNKAGMTSPTVDEMLANRTLLENTLKSDEFSKAFWGEGMACPVCGELERHQDVNLDVVRYMTKRQQMQFAQDMAAFLEPYL